MWSLQELNIHASLSDRRPVTIQSFAKHFLPVALCFYATAILTLLPRTIGIRLAIFPITLWTAFRATTLLDFSLGRDEFAYLNQALTLAMFTTSLRACLWTFRLEPYRRLKSAKKEGNSLSNNIMFDAFDLLFNLRGIGWSWPQRLRVPEETRDISSTRSFLLSTLLWFIRDLIAVDFSQRAVQSFSPETFGSLRGGTIFDPSLPLLSRYTCSTLITLLSGFTIYFSIDALYNFATLIAIAIFRQHPTLWPPISDKPYRATSLNQFWTLRWHQSFRDIFIGCGATPLTYLIGRAGGVMGAFLISGLLHDLGCWGMNRGTDAMKISGFFVMNGIGVILEHIYKSLARKRVDGLPGQIWTFTWLLVWGSMLVDAWLIRGVAGGVFLPSQWRPSNLAFGQH